MAARSQAAGVRMRPRAGRGSRDRATDRDVTVVAAVLSAGFEKAVAHRLGLAHSTAKHHLANARSKVGAETTAQGAGPGATVPGSPGRSTGGRSVGRRKGSWRLPRPCEAVVDRWRAVVDTSRLSPLTGGVLVSAVLVDPHLAAPRAGDKSPAAIPRDDGTHPVRRPVAGRHRGLAVTPDAFEDLIERRSVMRRAGRSPVSSTSRSSHLSTTGGSPIHPFATPSA